MSNLIALYKKIIVTTPIFIFSWTGFKWTIHYWRKEIKRLSIHLETWDWSWLFSCL